MRVLITGGYGFVGKHLAQHLVSCGDDVAVSYDPNKKTSVSVADNLSNGLPRSVQTLGLDVADAKAVSQLISVLRPDAIYHLAGRTFVPEGEQDVLGVFQVNTMGTIHLLEALKENSKETRFLIASSAEVYGDPRHGSLPLTESAVLRPISAYGVSKAAADLAAFKYAFRDGLHTIRVRSFPHIGPGQSDHFAISSFAKQVAEIKLGKKAPVILVGNLEVKRDYMDVSDVVRGYREALLNGKRGEVYNFCSGKSIGIGELLQTLLKVAEVEAEVQVDPERVRPVDIVDLYGSFEKAQKDFGWKPRIEIEATLHSLFAYWVDVIQKQKS